MYLVFNSYRVFTLTFAVEHNNTIILHIIKHIKKNKIDSLKNVKSFIDFFLKPVLELKLVNRKKKNVPKYHN